MYLTLRISGVITERKICQLKHKNFPIIYNLLAKIEKQIYL